MQSQIQFPNEEKVNIPNAVPHGQPQPPNIGVQIKLSSLPMKDRELAEAVAEAFQKHGFELAQMIRNL